MTTAQKTIPTHGGPRALPGRKNPRAKIAVAGNRGIKVVRAVTIQRPAAELYAFWRRIENLTRIIDSRVSITASSADESHWVVSALGGRKLEWDSLVINDEPNRLIAWRSRAGADVQNAGSVRFEPAPEGAGTEVTVALEYNPPGGRVGAALASVTRGAVSAQVGDVLLRFKVLMEEGTQSALRPPRQAREAKRAARS